MIILYNNINKHKTMAKSTCVLGCIEYYALYLT